MLCFICHDKLYFLIKQKQMNIFEKFLEIKTGKKELLTKAVYVENATM
jgi:hypothetical protein